MEVIKGIHQFNRGGNYYLVENEDELILIDTGIPGDTSKLVNYIKNTLKRDPQEIKTIILTHGDLDHIGNLSTFQKISGAKIAAHKEDALYISGQKKDKSLPIYLRFLIELIKAIYRPENVEVDILLEDGDKIENFRVMHCPGHTPGSICLYGEERKLIFVGDNLNYKNDKIKGPSTSFTPDINQVNDSNKKIGDLDIETIFMGHSKPILDNGAEKLREYLKTI